MSSPQTYRASSRRESGDASRLVLEQTTPHFPPHPISFLRNKKHLALSRRCLDRDLEAEKSTGLELKREQDVVVAIDSHPAGRLWEIKDGPTASESTNGAGALLEPECIVSSHRSKQNVTDFAIIKYTRQTVAEPLGSEYKPSRALANSRLKHSNETARAPLSPKYKPLGNRSKANSGDDACLVAAARKELHEQMMGMPAEICQMIMNIVFEEAFGPRRIYPHKDPPIMNIFLALDKGFYRKHHEQYWTKNTWVISKGPLNKTMRFMTEKPYNETTTEFSLQTPNKAALQIKSVELSFSKADTPDLPEWQQLAEQNSGPYIPGSGFGPFAKKHHDEAEVLQLVEQNAARMKRVQRYNDIQYQLIHTWQDKFDRIAMLNLERLTLDFTEAYDPDGLYLGVYIVQRLIPFAHGFPADFRIVAPDSWIERQISDSFLALNGG